MPFPPPLKYGSTTSHKLSILLTDQLGTATTAVDETSGQPFTRRSSKPFGETRGSQPFSWPNRRSYLRTGIDDTRTGLTHLGAREYDQSTGRFLSADPVIDPSDPLQINGYAYADNNPVTKSDPDGLQPIECWEGTAACHGGKIISAKPPKVVDLAPRSLRAGSAVATSFTTSAASRTRWARSRRLPRRRPRSTT